MREIHHELQVVLDQKHCHFPLLVNLADVARHVLCFLEVHSCRWLVKEQDRGLHCHRARDLNALAHAIRKERDVLKAIGLQLQEFDDLLAPFALGHFLAARRTKPERTGKKPRVHQVVAPEHQVIEHGERAEEPEVLEGPGNAAASQRNGALSNNLLALEANRPLLRSVDTIEAVEDRRFPGAIRTDDREQLAALHVERHAIERGNPAEPQRDVGHLEQRGRGGHALHRLRRR